MIEFITDLINYLRKERLVFGIVKGAKKKHKKNKFQLIDYYVQHDNTLYSSLKFIAHSVSSAYKPFKEKYKNIVREAYSITFNLMKYGDVVILKDNHKPLPPYALTIVEDESQIGLMSTNEVIEEANYYVINELHPERRKIYTADEVYHLSLNNYGTMIQDLLGRYCYNIYSIPPVEPLLKILEWKEFLIDTDILWRDRMIPKEHHKVDISFPFRNIPGKTIEEKLEFIRNYINQKLAEYQAAIETIEPGEHYITTSNVEIKVIEPKTSYSSPNELVEQLEASIVSGFNIPLSAVIGKAKSSYAAELAVGSYFMLSANSLVDIINKYFEDKYDDDFSTANVTLEIWKTEKFKRAALAAKIGVFTDDEIREIAGYPKRSGKAYQADAVDGRTIAGIENSNPNNEAITPMRTETKNKNMVDRDVNEVN